jgi:hypothetical protein
MAVGRGWGGASRAGSNHPVLACASAAPPYPRRGVLPRTYVAVYSIVRSCRGMVRGVPHAASGGAIERRFSASPLFQGGTTGGSSMR